MENIMKTTLKVDKNLHAELKLEACKQKIKLEDLTDKIFRDHLEIIKWADKCLNYHSKYEDKDEL
jgi:hypothetical protein